MADIRIEQGYIATDFLTQIYIFQELYVQLQGKDSYSYSPTLGASYNLQPSVYLNVVKHYNWAFTRHYVNV